MKCLPGLGGDVPPGGEGGAGPPHAAALQVVDELEGVDVVGEVRRLDDHAEVAVVHMVVAVDYLERGPLLVLYERI